MTRLVVKGLVVLCLACSAHGSFFSGFGRFFGFSKAALEPAAADTSNGSDLQPPTSNGSSLPQASGNGTSDPVSEPSGNSNSSESLTSSEPANRQPRSKPIGIADSSPAPNGGSSSPSELSSNGTNPSPGFGRSSGAGGVSGSNPIANPGSPKSLPASSSNSTSDSNPPSGNPGGDPIPDPAPTPIHGSPQGPGNNDTGSGKSFSDTTPARSISRSRAPSRF